MNWGVALPVLGALGAAALTGLVSVIVARYGSGDKARDRQSEDIWKFVNELQEELTAVRGEVRELRARSLEDQRTIAAHERTIQEQATEIARLRAQIDALGGC